MRRIGVFCGAHAGRNAIHREATERLGRLLAGRGLGVVYGGGSVGLMGVLADAALAGGGEVIGVIPDALAAREIAHRGVTDLRIVADMHARKALMVDLSDAFVTLPGGYGTMDELFEVVTWAQLGLHAKPVGLLNVDGYFDPLVAFVERAVAEGFVPRENSGLIRVAADPETLLEVLSVP